ncbi:hypothetical protein [Chlorogloeopsis sp. ULAP02]|uniref:hypothetical protein n=1 Tax=Chlorogloeopsis sp. ULAP02 TaxID=3107926 RepID=UPI003134861E
MTLYAKICEASSQQHFVGTDTSLIAFGRLAEGAVQLQQLGGATQVVNLPRGAEAGAQRSWQGTCPDRI